MARNDHSNCKNSNRNFTESESDGLCASCDGAGELISNFGGKHVHVKCPDCKGRGR